MLVELVRFGVDVDELRLRVLLMELASDLVRGLSLEELSELLRGEYCRRLRLYIRDALC